jgi:hypothetical protein
MTDLIFRDLGWPTLGVALLVFGFAPGALLRLIVLLYPRGNLRRRELIGELYAVPRIERPFWVVEQFEVALFEGFCPRIKTRRAAAFITIWFLIAILQTFVELLLKSQLGWSPVEADATTWAFTIIISSAAYSHFIGQRFHSEMTSEMRRLLLTEVSDPALIHGALPSEASRPPTSGLRPRKMFFTEGLFSPYREDARSRAESLLNEFLNEADSRSEKAQLLLEHINGCSECGPLAPACWICNPLKAVTAKVNAGRRTGN